MASVPAGQTITLLSQWYLYEGGPLADLDATPSIAITRIANGASVLADSTVGVTHPGAGAYGYAWTPAKDLTVGDYLATWTGTKDGAAVSAAETLTVTAPTIGRVYATVADFEAYPGGASPAPTETATRLVQASRMLDRQVLRCCMYDVDSTTGMPTHPTVIAALRDAVCAQAAWWDAVGDPTGADAVGWGSVSIGSVSLGRSVTAVTGEDAPARQLAPAAWDALQNPDLTGDIFRIGAVNSA